MCGIAGILTTELNFAAAVPLTHMQEALKHRGPDDAGQWSQPQGLAHYAHTRLAVLDLSSAGHQPMSTPDGRFCITFNGEIYNFAELRGGLERDGVTFHTRCDTEVILRIYEKHGADGVKLLRGMFAFALWDERERACVLARDRFGIKPLYYTQQGERLIFASELRAILASGLVQKETDGCALTRYLETGSVPEPLTMADGVKMLEAGCVLQWRDGKTQSRRWWNIAFPDTGRLTTRTEAAKLTRKALQDSVEHHFVSDVPVGIFLSGGVDSTALLALAHATGRRNIRTFSVGVDDATRDESALARRTAGHFGAQHTELRLTADTARELFAKFLNVVDQPTIDGFNTFCVAGLAREHGMKVVLSGLGGDELFGGYPSFAKLPLLWKLSRGLGPLRGMAGTFLQWMKPRSPLVRLASALRDGGSLEQVYDAFRGIFSSADARQLAAWWMKGAVESKRPSEQDQQSESERDSVSALERRRYMRTQLLRDSDVMFRGVFSSAKARRLAASLMKAVLERKQPPKHEQQKEGGRDRVSALEMRRYMRNQLLRDSDVMSMAHGLELRVPLVDSVLFDAVSQISPELRLRPGKQLLIDAVPEIPEWILGRPKSGFLFPYEDWLSTPEWQSMFADALRDVPVPVETWYQRWAVFMFRHWQAISGAVN
jgi:asparagine synthase (glutamine-hydrolysing)